MPGLLMQISVLNAVSSLHLDQRKRDSMRGYSAISLLDREKLLPLLLLADPDETLIDQYLSSSIVMVAKHESKGEEKDDYIGAIVLQRCEETSDINADNSYASNAVKHDPNDEMIETIEIMNLAVSPKFQQQGIGRRLLLNAINYAREWGFSGLKIATGNSSVHQLRLYQSMGFEIERVIVDYFVDHYPAPIYEAGIQCRDRIELRRSLNA